jgi:hypothetical protein
MPGGRTGPGPIAEATEAVTPQGTAGGGGSVLPVSTSPRLITAPPTAAAPGSSTGVEVGERNTRYMDRLLRGVVAASAHSRSKLGERPVGAGRAARHCLRCWVALGQPHQRTVGQALWGCLGRGCHTLFQLMGLPADQRQHRQSMGSSTHCHSPVLVTQPTHPPIQVHWGRTAASPQGGAPCTMGLVTQVRAVAGV